MVRTVVGVLRGGTSNEYPLSLKTGAAMLSALPEEKYDVRDIFIDRTGMWHSRGRPTSPARALTQIDVALNALHGGVGEDGTVQRLLERAGIPYAGSSPSAANLAHHKARTREMLSTAGIVIPQGISFNLDSGLTTSQMARQVFERFGPPYVVKPATEGASNGILISATIVDLPDALGDILDAYHAVVVEEFIRGHDATVSILQDFRGEELYAFPPAHLIVPDNSRIIRPEHHTDGNLIVSVPSNFSHEEKNALMHMARVAHRTLGLAHFSRTDFRLTPRRAYLLEVNSTPKLYEGSVQHQMLESVGSSISEYLEHSIGLALAR